MFGEGAVVPHDGAARSAWDDPAPVSAGWLVSRIWIAAPAVQSIRYEQALFASRWLGAADAAHADAVATILRGYARYPQLLRVLDRVGVEDVARLDALVRRADGLAHAAADWRGHAAIVRWQSALVFLDHMTRLGAIERDELIARSTRWRRRSRRRPRAAPRVRALLTGLGDRRRRRRSAVASGRGRAGGAADAQPARRGPSRHVGRAGLSHRRRRRRARPDRACPRPGRAGAPRRRVVGLRAVGCARRARRAGRHRTNRAAWSPRRGSIARPAVDERLGIEARTAAATARRLLERGRLERDWPEIRRSLDDLGDALATEALAEMAYAVSLGWAEDLPLTALAAFRRHVFTRSSPTGNLDATWLAPEILTERGEAWHVAGSLLGLGDALGAGGAAASVAETARHGAEPEHGRPALAGHHRCRVRSRRLTDDAQRQLVAAVARGEVRVRGCRGADAARQLAEDAGATPLRQTLAAWMAEVEPARPGRRPVDDRVVRLGSEGGAAPEALDGWGTAQRPVTGRLTGGPLPGGRGNGMPVDPSGWYRAPCPICR